MGIPLNVLIIEDSDDDLLLLLHELKRSGYDPIYQRVETRPEMIEALRSRQWDVILSDYALPHFSGGEALKLCQEFGVDCPFIVISGMIGETTAVEMMKAGANDYLMKGSMARLAPAIERELIEHQMRRDRKLAEASLRESESKFSLFMDHLPVQVFVKDAQGRMTYANRCFRETFPQSDWHSGSSDERIGSEQTQEILSDDSIALAGEVVHRVEAIPLQDGLHYFQTMKFLIPSENEKPLIGGIMLDISDSRRAEEQLRRAAEELAVAYDTTLEGWSYALELREKETAGHSRRVVALTLAMAQLHGLPEQQIIHVRRGALLHDIGKLGVPDYILLKPGPLTPDEWVTMRQHPTYARDWLARIPYLRNSIDIPYAHHEKWNGQGYPRNLRGDEIPLAARIFTLSDVWDALTTNRPYRPAWPEKAALDFIVSQAGEHFDPQVVEAFCSMSRELRLFLTADSGEKKEYE